MREAMITTTMMMMMMISIWPTKLSLCVSPKPKSVPGPGSIDAISQNLRDMSLGAKRGQRRMMGEGVPHASGS